MTEAPPTPHADRWARVALVLLGIALSLYHAVQGVVNDDEVYHLRSAWALAQGQRPYVDFFTHHLPGLWVLSQPLVWLTDSGVALIWAGKLAIPLLFGASLALLIALIEARGVRLALLGLFALWGGITGEFFFFRAETVAAPLILWHLVALVRALEEDATPGALLWAMAPLGLAMSLSVRPLIFLPVALVAIALLKPRTRWPMAALQWLAGLLLGLLPMIAVVLRHDLVAEMRFWCFEFPTTPGIAQWGRPMDASDFVLFVLAVQAVVVLAAVPALLPPARRIVLLTALVLTSLFHLTNPLRNNAYESIHFAFLLAAAGAVVLEHALARIAERLSARGIALTQQRIGCALALLGIAAFPITRSPYRPFDRLDQRLELETIAWLEAVAGEDSVVLIAPLHPIGVRDATDLMQSWEYSYWLESPFIQARLEDFTAELAAEPPAVINANPWESNTGGRDLLEWLYVNEVITLEEARQIARGIQRDYAQVEFPYLDLALEGPAYGHRFWVRTDRLDAAQIPEPHRIVAPTFTQVGALPPEE